MRTKAETMGIEFEDFCNRMKGAVEERTGKHYELNNVILASGRRYKGLHKVPGPDQEGDNMEPIFPMDALFERYEDGEGFDDLSAELMSRMDSVVAVNGEDEEEEVRELMHHFKDYSSVKDLLSIHLFNKRDISEAFVTKPYVSDINLVYCLDGSKCSMAVTKDLLTSWGVSDEELHEDALKSWKKHNELRLLSMTEMLLGLSDGAFDISEIPEDTECPIWVASNESGRHGATAILSEEFLKQTAEKLGGDFYIIPSSKHECLFLPANNHYSAEELESMLQTVNCNEVGPEDFLSDKLLYYAATDHSIIVARESVA